jgi:hypothetical protein
LIEAELKARVHDPGALRAWLRRLASEELSSLMRLWQVQKAGRLGELAPDRQVWP